MEPTSPERTGVLFRSTTRVLGARLADAALNLAFTAVLANLFLTPGDFGIMSMALTGFALLGSMTDFGLPHAVVHHGLPEDSDALFRRNAALALALGAAMSALAWPIARFYGEPDVAQVMLAVSGVVALAALFNLHVAVLRRQMRFGALAAAEVTGTAVGGAGGLLVGYLGGGAWALFALFSAPRLALGMTAWRLTRWRPSLTRSPEAGRPSSGLLEGYARRVTVARLLGNVARNAYRIVVGRLGGDSALGLYQSANRFGRLPADFAGGALLGVAVSALSRQSASREQRFRETFRLGLEGLSALVIPISIAIALEADLVVDLLRGNGWTDAVPALRLLGCAALAIPFTQAAKWAFLSEGRTHAYVRSSLVTAPCLVAGLLLGTGLAFAFPSAASTLCTVLGGLPDSRTGGLVTGVAAGYAGAMVLLVPYTVAITVRGSRLRPSDLLLPLTVPVLCTFAGVGLWAIFDAPSGDGPMAGRLAASAPAIGAFSLLPALHAIRVLRRSRGAVLPPE